MQKRSDYNRKKIDFSGLPILKQAIVIIVCIAIVIILVWFFSKDKDSIFWFWQYMPKVLLYISPLIVIGIYWLYKMIKLRKKFKKEE